MIPCSLNVPVLSIKGNAMASPFKQEQIQPFILNCLTQQVWRGYCNPPGDLEKQEFKSVLPQDNGDAHLEEVLVYVCPLCLSTKKREAHITIH